MFKLPRPAALAAVVPLAGCMTVHGERENIPSASKKEAASAVARFIAVTNEVSRDYDAKKVLTRLVEELKSAG